MGMRVLACVCLLLVASAFAGVVYQTGDVPTDETLTRIEVEGDGDAVFVLELRTVLETDEERASFEDFADGVENDPEASVSGFRASVESLVETARNQTGRGMSVSNFTVETRTEPLPVERGVVEYSFEWNGFAESDGELRAGDVLSGYLLSEDDALVLRPPDGYEVSSADPTPDSTDDELRWNGPEGFADDEPRAVFTPDSDGGDGGSGAQSDESSTDNATTQNGGPSEGTGADANPSQGGGEGGVPLYAYGIAVVVVLSAAAVAYRALPESGKPTGSGGPPGENGEAASSEEEEREEKVKRPRRTRKCPTTSVFSG